jgi:hypothetical protein
MGAAAPRTGRGLTGGQALRHLVFRRRALTSGSRFTPAVSPDGSQIAYTVERGTKDLLAIRSLNESKAAVSPGTEGANLPFSSPDGRFIRWPACPSGNSSRHTGGNCGLALDWQIFQAC